MWASAETLKLASLWRDRAAEARAQAKAMSHDELRRVLLGIAALYDKMADDEEAQAESQKNNGR